MGAGGFTGQELIRLFNNHPLVDLRYITSEAYKGLLLKEAMSKLDFLKYEELVFSAHPASQDDIPELDVIFLAVPDEVSMNWAGIFLSKKTRVIDISGAYRLKEPSEYEKYYNFSHKHPELLKESVYGLAEVFREAVKKAKLVANPGCYATAAILPLYAIGRFANIASSRLIVDAKSGTSGAGGRKEKDSFSYSAVQENFKAYRTVKHQHIPEISQEVSSIMKSACYVNMTPHLLPLFRGLQVNSYIYLEQKLDEALLRSQLKEYAKGERFLRFYDDVNHIEIKNVQGSNFLDFGFVYDEESGLLQIISVIDNLVKGAAGQAIQNMNLMFGFAEHQGLP